MPAPKTCEPLVPVPGSDSAQTLKHLRADLTTLKADLAALRTRLQKLEQRPGPPGPPGKDGQDGRDGKDAQVDVDRLADAVRRRLRDSVRVKVEQVKY